MRRYAESAVERAMKVQEVLVRAIGGQISWVQAGEILGLCPRQVLRLRRRFQEDGYSGLFDRRREPSPKRVPVATLEQVLRLYREVYPDFNVQHFHETLRERHQIELSYSWVKKALQTAGLVPVSKRRGAHRRRRERRPLPGMLLHIDASRHAWIPGGQQDLVSISDDATNELYYARLVPEENTLTVLAALQHVVAHHGIFCALYSDRASHFIHTPAAGHERFQTQVERALQQLGIETIAAHSPQARGRKERLYGTVQGRWPQELRVNGIASVDAANAWLAEDGIRRFNTRFGVAAAQEGTAFVPAAAPLDRIFSVQHERTVANDNTVQIGRRHLQLGASPLRCHFVRCRVLVHEHLDGTLTVTHGPHVIGRYTNTGEPLPREVAA